MQLVEKDKMVNYYRHFEVKTWQSILLTIINQENNNSKQFCWCYFFASSLTRHNFPTQSRHCFTPLSLVHSLSWISSLYNQPYLFSLLFFILPAFYTWERNIDNHYFTLQSNHTWVCAHCLLAYMREKKILQDKMNTAF